MKHVIGAPMSCERCGRKIIRKSGNQLYCTVCGEKARRESDAGRVRPRHTPAEPERIAPRPKHATIEEVNARAREMHMSYGKYVALYGGGR